MSIVPPCAGSRRHGLLENAAMPVVPVGTEFQVNTNTLERQEDSWITGLANGNFAITWQDQSGTLGDYSGTSIKAKIYTATGALVRSEFLVNTVISNNQ